MFALLLVFFFLFSLLCFDSFVSLGHFYEEHFIILLRYSSAF